MAFHRAAAVAATIALVIACTQQGETTTDTASAAPGPASGGGARGGGCAEGATCAEAPCGAACTGEGDAGDGGGGSDSGADAGPVEDCTKYPFKAETLLAERVGFGRKATGGDPKNVYHVTTLAGDGPGSLRRALESTAPYWIVFDVNGKITHTTRVMVKSNKTIDGRGRDIDIEGLLQLTDVKNVIISDVKVENSLEGHCTQAGDVINTSSKVQSPKGTYTMRDVWIHHVEAFNGGDGLIDLRGGTDYTLSWSHLHTHKKGLLWSNETDLMRVTAHHNFLDRISLRGPQFIGGQIHYFNNYQYQWFEYGAGSLGGAQFYSENNVYEARPGTSCVPSCKDPNPCGDTEYFPKGVSKAGLVTDWASNGTGYTKSVGDLALEGALLSVNEPSRVFDPGTLYAYTSEPASAALAAKVKAGAGPRVRYCQTP